MSEIAELLELQKEGVCWCGCGEPTNAWFATGHDYRFVMAMVRRLEFEQPETASRIAREIKDGSSDDPYQTPGH